MSPDTLATITEERDWAYQQLLMARSFLRDGSLSDADETLTEIVDRLAGDL